MSPHLSTHSATESLPDKLDLQMLHGAQTYLRCLQGHQNLTLYESNAWRWFYETYDPLVRRFVRANGLDQPEAEDCIQEAWKEVVRTLGAFDSEGTQGRLCSWLHTIVHSKATDLLRYRQRHPTRRLHRTPEAAMGSREADPAFCYEQHCRQEAVQHVLGLLRR
jgi:RNA polymerase sigma factor (sigma-70 family)